MESNTEFSAPTYQSEVFGSSLEKRVKIIDDIVPVSIGEDLLRFMRSPIWAYGWKSVKDRDPFPFWHAHFAGAEDLSSCEEELFDNARAVPVAKLWRHLSSGLLRNHKLVRAYANGHTYGGEGYLHIDSPDEQYFTTLYYAHAAWELDWAGETVFFEGGSPTGLAVIPEPGRVVHFPGNLPHVARGVSRSCAELRISVVLKTVAPMREKS